MGKAVAFVVTAILAGLLVYWLVAPRLLDSGKNTPPTASAHPTLSPPPDAPSEPSPHSPLESAPVPDRPLEVPPTPAQQQQITLETKRRTFYGKLHQNFPDLLRAVRPADEDPATLELWSDQTDTRVVAHLLTHAVQPDAFYYGFRRVRFYLPNPPGEATRYRLAAEAVPDPSGQWNAFFH